jgi:hypothetical protein
MATACNWTVETKSCEGRAVPNNTNRVWAAQANATWGEERAGREQAASANPAGALKSATKRCGNDRDDSDACWVYWSPDGTAPTSVRSRFHRHWGAARGRCVWCVLRGTGGAYDRPDDAGFAPSFLRGRQPGFASPSCRRCPDFGTTVERPCAQTGITRVRSGGRRHLRISRTDPDADRRRHRRRRSSDADTRTSAPVVPRCSSAPSSNSHQFGITSPHLGQTSLEHSNNRSFVSRRGPCSVVSSSRVSRAPSRWH